MTDGHKHYCCRGSGFLVNSIINTSRNDEENSQNKERNCEPFLAWDAIRENDEAKAPSNRRQGDCKDILFSLLY